MLRLLRLLLAIHRNKRNRIDAFDLDRYTGEPRHASQCLYICGIA